MSEYSFKLCEDGKGFTALIGGRIDSANAADFEKELLAAREADPEGTAVLDLTNLEYISSAGLRALLKLQKKEKDKVKLEGVSGEIYEILDITGFASIFDIAKL